MADVSNGQLQPILYSIIFYMYFILIVAQIKQTSNYLNHIYYLLCILIFQMQLIGKKKGVPVAQSCLH